jgi:hypothetical protein
MAQSHVHYVYADSINRAPGQSGNSYSLSLTHDLRNIEKVELLSVTVPHVAYNITDGTNIITINGTNDYSIPKGFYCAKDLAAILSNTVPNYTFTYLPDQGVFVIKHNNNYTITFNTEEIRLRMGFSAGTYTSIDHTLTPYSAYVTEKIVYSDRIVDLSTNKFVFLDIEELRHESLIDSKVLNTMDGTYQGSTIARTFAAIPMDVIPDWVSTKGFKKDYEYYIKYEVPLARLNRLTIRWLDYNGQLLNFNGMERNCILLRVFCRPSAPPAEKKEFDEDQLIKKLQRMIDDAFPPPPPPKKGLKRWYLILPVLLAVLFGVFKLSQRIPPVGR